MLLSIAVLSGAWATVQRKFGAAGQLMLILMLIFLATFILTRKDASTYEWPLVGCLCLFAAFGLTRLIKDNRLIIIALAIVAGTSAIDRIQGVQLGHANTHTASFYNLYRDEHAMTLWIANDCHCTELHIRFDISRETPEAFIPSFGAVDMHYYDGMEIGSLLVLEEHLLVTQNTPKYIIVRTSLLKDYDLSRYQVVPFKGYTVLKAKSE